MKTRNLSTLAVSLMRSMAPTERAKLARAILDRELRLLLPEVLTARISGRLMNLDTAGMDDDAIVTLSLLRPPRAWTRLTVAAIRAMRACVWIAEHPDDPRAVDHLTVTLAECEAASTKHIAVSAGGKGRAERNPGLKAKRAAVTAEVAKPRPRVPARNRAAVDAIRAKVDPKTARKYRRLVPTR